MQVSETVSWQKFRFCYSYNMLQHWLGERGLIYFWKVDHYRISRNFSRNWLGLINVWLPNIPGSWKYRAYKGFWMCLNNLDNSWICLNMTYEYTRCSDYAMVLIMLGFWIYFGFEYAMVLNMLGCWIYLDSEYSRVLNIPGFRMHSFFYKHKAYKHT